MLWWGFGGAGFSQSARVYTERILEEIHDAPSFPAICVTRHDRVRRIASCSTTWRSVAFQAAMTLFLGLVLGGPASANLRGCILSASLRRYMMRRVYTRAD